MNEGAKGLRSGCGVATGVVGVRPDAHVRVVHVRLQTTGVVGHGGDHAFGIGAQQVAESVVAVGGLVQQIVGSRDQFTQRVFDPDRSLVEGIGEGGGEAAVGGGLHPAVGQGDGGEAPDGVVGIGGPEDVLGGGALEVGLGDTVDLAAGGGGTAGICGSGTARSRTGESDTSTGRKAPGSPPSRKRESRHQLNSTLAFKPCRRAADATEEPGSKVSAATRA